MVQPFSLPSHLTPSQLSAILHRGTPLLILAGPGSGKTEVIACRIAHLVQAGDVRPENVLATTFTNRAALELKDRIQKKLPGVPVELMQVSTIHSFCAELLRRYRRQSAFPRGFHILDDTAQLAFVYGYRKALGLDGLCKCREDETLEAVLRVFSLATEEMVEPGRLDNWCQEGRACCCEDESRLWEERALIAEAYRRYCALTLEQSLCDYAFLQRYAIALMETHPQVLAELREQYREILVDEYQDTNAAQDRLLKLLAGDGAHLTVVGDDDQGIYRFRGATVRNIRSFAERYPGTREVLLDRNFRSPDPIVQHSLRVIRHNPGRFPKELASARFTRADVRLVYEHTADEEARATVDVVRRLHDAGRIPHYSDVAILLRSVRSYADSYRQALEEAGITHYVIGEATFFEREEIAQLYNLFNFIAVTKPDVDRHLRQPLVGLSPAAVAALEAYKESLDALGEEGLQEIGITDAEDRRKLLDLLALKQRVQAREHRSLLEVYYRLLAATGCVAHFEREGNVEALANLGQLSRLITAWDEVGPTRTFYPFREYMGLLRQGGLEPVLFPPADAVQVMTIHQAKGLEFPVVVLGAAMKGRLPTSPRKNPYEIPHEMRASGKPEVDDPHTVDERKLYYVAATRARDLLLVGTADVVNKRGGGPSPFVCEMFGEDLQAAADRTREYVADVESKAAARGPIPRYSFSQLAHYLQCPMRYKLAEVYGLQSPGLDPVDFGSNVHRALEEIHARALGGSIPDEEEIETIVAESWIPNRRISPDRQAGIQTAAVRQLRRYVSRHRGTLSRVLRAETHFSFPLGERVLLGKIDLLRQAGEGRVEVIDFKTSGEVDVELEHYDLQMDLYALGTEESLRHPVGRRIVHFLGDDVVKELEWRLEQTDTARAHLEELLAQIEKQHFPPRPAYCRRCEEYRAICPYAASKEGVDDEIV